MKMRRGWSSPLAEHEASDGMAADKEGNLATVNIIGSRTGTVLEKKREGEKKEKEKRKGKGKERRRESRQCLGT
jgi:hypothetical protein